MSWMAKLCETYDQGKTLDLPLDEQLMPISHTPQNAHINIAIDQSGNFLRASVLEKTQIVLPATERSAGRSSGEAPHPLADKLQYVAKDYADYGGKKTSYFTGYKKQLQEWCESEFSHPHAVAVYNYINKGAVVKDLMEHSIVYVSENNVLLTKWTSSDVEPPALFKTLPKEKGNLDQGNALVCWSVEKLGDPDSNTWESTSLRESWINYDAAKGSRKGFCFVNGEQKVLATSHPAKLRHTGDKAKLVSANDMSGYTFRGRFTDTSKSAKADGYQSVGVSLDITQKAHNALRWLISRQGFRNGDQAIVAWAVSGVPLPDPMQSSWEMLSGELPMVAEPADANDLPAETDHATDLGQSFAIKLNKYMAGYRAKLSATESAVLMALDAATPGRMSITYYRETLAHEFIETVTCWHEDLAWFQRHKKEVPDGARKPRVQVIWPISAPAPKLIWEAVYGKTLTDNLKRNFIERIFPCIVEGRTIPFDIVNSCVHRASNPNGLEKWQWEQSLGVACSLFKGYHCRHPDQNKRRKYLMALEQTNTSRDYLYGRLLAVAERIEQIALQVAGENRATTSERMMQRFAERPFSTWRTIELSLQPYIQRLKNTRTGFLVNRQKDLDTILNAFDGNDFTSEKPLSGEFLLGFHCQRLALREQKETAQIKH